MSADNPPVGVLMPDDPDDRDQLEIDGMDVPALRRELRRVEESAARNVRRWARILVALERKGEDVRQLLAGLKIARYLHRIASGRIAAEAAERFGGLRYLLDAVAALPPARQRALAEGEPVAVAEQHEGGFTYRMLPVNCLSLAQVRLVFDTDAGCVRTADQQIALLRPKPEPAVVSGKPRVRVDLRRGVVYADGATVGDVLDALRRAGVI